MISRTELAELKYLFNINFQSYRMEFDLLYFVLDEELTEVGSSPHKNDDIKFNEKYALFGKGLNQSAE